MDPSRLILVASLLGAALSTSGSAQDRLSVHEWGTFTCLQDERGAPIGGVNTDDEPVPGFVHRVADMLYLGPHEVPPLFLKGAPRCHPDATMRLETPVIYFHLPEDHGTSARVDVRVGFRGGWLTEYYPAAEVVTPGLGPGSFDFGPIRPDSTGTLTWEDLRLAASGSLPETDAHVWLAPRAVDAAVVTARGGESERYLFYRGVGNLTAPLSVARGAEGTELLVRRAAGVEGDFTRLWLAAVRPDGAVAWRAITPEANASTGLLARTAAAFSEAEYDVDHLAGLRSELLDALVADGLFADEAGALLSTWEQSYFHSHGLRLFFLVPRAWTDAVLPLELSVESDVVRTMVGRIELVTPSQRALLAQIAAGPLGDTGWFESFSRGLTESDQADAAWDGWRRAMAGESLLEIGMQPPQDYIAFVALGRFRNALLLDELARNPSEGLARFVEAYGLQAFEPMRRDEGR